MENLWPDMNELQKIKTPKEILEEQGNFLPQLTNNLVYTSVDMSEVFKKDFSVGSKYDFAYDYYIKGKNLGDFKFRVFTVGHNITPFPARIRLDSDIRKELGLTKQDIMVENQSEFVNLLRDVLKSNKLKHVIASVLSLSK